MQSHFAVVMLAAMSLAQVPSAPSFERVPPFGGTSSGDRPVSPAVVASWIARLSSPQRTASLEILVLWRGTPGWFRRGPGGGMSYGGGGGTREVQTIVQRSSHGGIVLELEFTTEGPTRSLRLQGRDVPLDGGNVVLVDDVDSPQGPTVIGTRFVDPAMTEAHNPAEVLRRSPEIVSFLRCDTQLPDPVMQMAMGILCAQVTP
jgi:hypothetical protein